MTFYFAPYEIAQLAMQIEEEGQIFYIKIANVTQNESAKKMFKFLSDQELIHKQTFQNFAAESEHTEKTEEYSVDVRSQMAVLLDFIKRKSFSFDSVTSDTKDIIQAVDVGIQIEIQSISVYQLAKQTFIDKFTPLIDRIIMEEESHLGLLRDYKNKFEAVK